MPPLARRLPHPPTPINRPSREAVSKGNGLAGVDAPAVERHGRRPECLLSSGAKGSFPAPPTARRTHPRPPSGTLRASERGSGVILQPFRSAPLRRASRLRFRSGSVASPGRFPSVFVPQWLARRPSGGFPGRFPAPGGPRERSHDVLAGGEGEESRGEGSSPLEVHSLYRPALTRGDESPVASPRCFP